jgi:hypothetical protein
MEKMKLENDNLKERVVLLEQALEKNQMQVKKDMGKLLRFTARARLLLKH